MKKVLSLILAITLAVSTLAGCSNNAGTASGTSSVPTSSAASGQNPKKFKIGFPWATSSTDPTFVSIVTNVKAAVESAGGELVLVESDLTADSLVNNVSDLISRGVDGIIFMPASDSMLPTVDRMCSDAGVYYSTMFRTISDTTIRNQIYSSKYFAGGCNEDDEKCAYNITKTLSSQGVKNLCVINIAKGDTSSDLRDSGVAKAVKETGIKLLNTTYGITVQTDMTKTIESYIAAYPEMDGILIAGTYCPAALPTIEKALSDHNLAGKIKVGRIDFDFTMGQYFANKSFNVAYGGQQQIDPLLSTVILVNSVIGTPIVKDKPFILVTNYLELTSKSEADNFLTYFLGDTPVYTSDEIKKNLIKFYNSNINEDTFKKTVDSFTVADVAARHKDLVKK
jgi:ABC-type sugar transport system substrate-binding protein